MADARGGSSGGGTQGGPLPVSSGLVCLCVMAGHHQRATDPHQLAHFLGWDPAAPLDETQLLLGARQLGLKAKPLRSSWEGLARVHLPVIAEFHDNSYVLVLRRDGADRVLIGDPRASRPQPLDREQFTALWSGKLLPIKARLQWDNPNRPFDLIWFVPAIWKYRRILGEILAQSLVTIVPDGAPLIVEATVSNEDIGYLELGQHVEVKVDTFPFQRYGTLAGTLVWISPDAEDRNATAHDSEIRAGTAAADSNQTHDVANASPNAGYVYKVHIRTAQASLLVAGESHAVVSGMTVQADITTEQRRVIDFFLSPVIKYLDEGMKVR